MFPKSDTIAFGSLFGVRGSLLPELGEGEESILLLLVLAGDAIAPKTIAVHIFPQV